MERPLRRGTAWTTERPGAGGTLAITDDAELVGTLERVCAATGTELATVARAPERSRWRAADLIVLDLRAAEAVAGAQLPRRDGIVVVCVREPTVAQLSVCVQLGVETTVTPDQVAPTVLERLGRGSGTSGPGRVVGVVGACGGAGASVFAAALAIAATKEARSTVLVDCDRWGAGLDVLMGLEGSAGVRWPDLAAPAGRLAPQALHRALPTGARANGRIPVLTFDRDRLTDVPADVADVVISSLRSGGDTVVVDVPRVPTAAGDRAVELADLVVLVTPADVRGCFAAQRQSEKLRATGSRVVLLVRGPAPGGLGADDLAEVLGLPLVAALRPQARIARDLEAGRAPGGDPRSPFGRAARAVLSELDRSGR